MEDSKTTFDIVFVSAFGRHHWIASELAKSEWQVAHVDVSKLLGSWEDQDLKNPFGLAVLKDLNREQLQSWHRLTKSQKVENGTTILLEGGPLEAHGPLKDFYRKRLAPLGTQKFDDDWISGLSRQMASSIYMPNSRAFELETAVPIFEEVYKDSSTFETRNSENFFKDFEMVMNLTPSKLASFEKLPDGFFKIDVDVANEGEKRGARETRALKTRVVVWALTSSETEHLSHDVCKAVFSEKNIEPSWAWQRYTFKGPHEVIDLWPIQFYLLNHLRLPWTHENFGLISKRFSSTFDVWLRVPIIFRFNSDYHFELAEKVKKNLQKRFSSDEFEAVELPVETKLGKEKLGPPRYPIYSREENQVFKIAKQKNDRLIFESCETLQTHQAQAQLGFQNQLLEKLTLMRKQWLAIEAKLNQKAINRELNQRN